MLGTQSDAVLSIVGALYVQTRCASTSVSRAQWLSLNHGWSVVQSCTAFALNTTWLEASSKGTKVHAGEEACVDNLRFSGGAGVRCCFNAVRASGTKTSRPSGVSIEIPTWAFGVSVDGIKGAWGGDKLCASAEPATLSTKIIAAMCDAIRIRYTRIDTQNATNGKYCKIKLKCNG
jgi:hypothetical protein